MKRAIKLVIYYYGYQLLFTALLVFPMNLAKVFQNGEATTSMNDCRLKLTYLKWIRSHIITMPESTIVSPVVFVAASVPVKAFTSPPLFIS